jgi:hypothetical protein
MQFTALNTMAFAEIEPDVRAAAATMAAVSQQVGAALGVAFAALGLSIAQSVHGASQPSLSDFQFVLWACAAMLAIAGLWFLRLHANVGAEATANKLPQSA